MVQVLKFCISHGCILCLILLKREPGQHCTRTEVAVRPWGHFAGDMKSEKTLILLPFVCLPCPMMGHCSCEKDPNR